MARLTALLERTGNETVDIFQNCRPLSGRALSRHGDGNLMMTKTETCGVCGCRLHRGRDYAAASVAGRSHATRHHYVAERFFGRSANRRGEIRGRVCVRCPWGAEGKSQVFCYECHELVLHNPVLLPEDLKRLRDLVILSGLSERTKPAHVRKLAGRIELLHDIIEAGLGAVLRRRRRDNTRLERTGAAASHRKRSVVGAGRSTAGR